MSRSMLINIMQLGLILLLMVGCESTESDEAKVEALFILSDGQSTEGVDVEVVRKPYKSELSVGVENAEIVSELASVEKWEDMNFGQLEKTSSATDGTSSWVANDKIGIFMRGASGGSSYFDLNNVQYNVTSSAQTSGATPVSSTIYFPNPKSQNVIFYGYYPYNVANTLPTISYTIPTNQTDAAVLASADLMSATSSSVNSTTPNVSLNFQHKLVMLTLNIKAGLLGGLLSQVKVNGTAITNTGSLNLLTNTLTPSTTSTFTPTIDTNITLGIGQTTTVNFIINPCVISNNSTSGNQLYVTMSYAGLDLKRTNLAKDITFQGGNKYVFNINFAL